MKPPVETEIKLQLNFECRPPRAPVLPEGQLSDSDAAAYFEQNLVCLWMTAPVRCAHADCCCACAARARWLPAPSKARRWAAVTRAGWNRSLARRSSTPVSRFFARHWLPRNAFATKSTGPNYKRAGEAGHATLDETPIGVFMELEGPARWIDRTAAELGFPRESWITSSYVALYFEWCAKNKRRPASMVFGKTRR